MSARQERDQDKLGSKEKDFPTVEKEVTAPTCDFGDQSESTAQVPRGSKRSATDGAEDDVENNHEILKKSKLDSPEKPVQGGEDVRAAINDALDGAGDRGDLACCRDGFLCDQTDETHAAAHSHMNRALGFYMTKCEGIDDKYNADTFTRSLKQILHEDVGDTLESAVHFSFVYRTDWLVNQYPEKYRDLPMLLVVQQSKEVLDPLIAVQQTYPNVTLLPIQMPPYGVHHSKMISLKYKTSIRIIVATANLFEPDWSKKSQMVWVSPLLKKVGTKQGQDSFTGFRSSLCAYLRSYKKQELIDLADSYADYDFSSIQSYFIGSSPNILESGLMSLDSILKRNVSPISKDCPVTFCFSSVGSLRNNDAAWLRSVFGKRLLSSSGTLQNSLSIDDVTKTNIQPVYPTVEEVRTSLEGYEAGRSLPYSGMTHMRQEWVSQWFHNWKADRSGRSRAAPHVKFYIRTSADYEHTYWFLMSSANLSQAAWGNAEWRAPLSYECGILHIPEEPVKTNGLVVPFDLPPKRYKATDQLWLQSVSYTVPDDHGNFWDSQERRAVPRSQPEST